jgi:hypothetical protein
MVLVIKGDGRLPGGSNSAGDRGRSRTKALFLTILMLALALCPGCSTESGELPPADIAQVDPQDISIPLVTLKHWKDSTPGERYSFLIGFVTMLELEKECQGRNGRELLPFEQSLIGAWVRGFENRPLAEIYNGLNRFIADNPGDLDRPVALVMWFLFAQPRMLAERISEAGGSAPDSDQPGGSNQEASSGPE